MTEAALNNLITLLSKAGDRGTIIRPRITRSTNMAFVSFEVYIDDPKEPHAQGN